MARLRLRTERLQILAGIAFLVLATAIYFVIQKGKLQDAQLATDKTLLTSVFALIVVLVFWLAWVMIRNLVQVVVERRRGIIGSRLKLRLAVTFLLLVFVPALFLFIASITMVTHTLRQLAPRNVTSSVEMAADGVDQLLQRARKSSLHYAGQLADDLAAAMGGSRREGRSIDLDRQIHDGVRRYDLAAAGLETAAGRFFSARNPQHEESADLRLDELVRLPPGMAERVRSGGQGAVFEETMIYGWRAVAIEPVILGGKTEALVWAVVYLPKRLMDKVQAPHAAREALDEVARHRVPLTRLYIALFALLTLLIMFAAVWAGLYMARQVTGPLMELAQGTEALARGDLEHRVSVRGSDETAYLARSFNRMAEEIQTTRHALEFRGRYIESLLQTIPVGVFSIDKRGFVTTSNRAALDILRLEALQPGILLEEALGSGREDIARAIEPILAGEVPRISTEVSLEVDDGKVSIQVSATTFEVEGHGGGVLVGLEDLTRLRRAERLSAWGEVARRVAHEIKNPLTPIRLAAERLLKRYRQDRDAAAPAIEDGVRTVVRQVESLQSLVDEFSRFARLPEVRPQADDLNRVTEEALLLYRGTHPGVEIEWQPAEDVPMAMVDAAAIQRCVINLLDNAVSSVGEGGRIAVRTYRHEEVRRVVVEVSDDGHGIAQEDRDQLFLPNFTRRPGGTGLGLAIVHRIVTEHGGRIRAEDSESGGARMVIEVPAAG